MPPRGGLEPLAAFDTMDSQIKLNYTQLFSFHVSFNNLNPSGQPQSAKWFNIGKKVNFTVFFRLFLRIVLK